VQRGGLPVERAARRIAATELVIGFSARSSAIAISFYLNCPSTWSPGC